jgi:hypothetical protein
MVKLNMLSHSFAHDKGSTANKPPVNIEWCFNSYDNPISVYIDNDLFKGIQDHKNDGGSRKKFLWLLESRQFDLGASNNVKNNLTKVLETFEQIWTHNDELLRLNPKFKWTPSYGSYIKEFGIHPKTKLASMITSDKKWTGQHKIRYNFAMSNRDKIDLYGRGINEIPNKEIGLKDYMFSFAVENDTYDTYFTEKILDCFATGTIPVYMGTRKIVEYFNSDGILFFDGNFDISILTPELYYSKMEAIKDNYNRVQEYSILDDWIYKNHLINYIQ